MKSMKKKILAVIGWAIPTAVGIVLIFLFEIKGWPVGASVGGIIAGWTVGQLFDSIVDLRDTNNWKTSQTKLKRGGFINDETKIRVSFAYLFRIQIDGKYFLVKNGRGTGKYQPVGGVYKMHETEARCLRQIFSAEDDNKIPIDESSKMDYRLIFPNHFLRKFIKRFNKTKNRELIDNLTREFKEELFDSGILTPDSFERISYSYCGRHFTDLQWGEHFQCYEMLMADIVELKLDSVQEQKFRELVQMPSPDYIFASADEIESLGVKAGSTELVETIADHTKKILSGNGYKLEAAYKVGKIYKSYL